MELGFMSMEVSRCRISARYLLEEEDNYNILDRVEGIVLGDRVSVDSITVHKLLNVPSHIILILTSIN
ncbi:hypothetical protein CEK25_008395 [Fusarium fujikuroi]|nr:hypothetical protein CEK25_008395 [Fusarium fujikuroi]